MAQVVHDLAPGATLGFESAHTATQFPDLVAGLRSWAANVIVDDMILARRAVLPGGRLAVELFDSAGNLVRSRWATALGGRCAVDTAANVYVRSGIDKIMKYDLTGHLIQTFQVASYPGPSPYYLALAPDQCTIYYGAWDSRTGRFDVCTKTQESPLFLNSGLIDDLRIRPNWQIVATGDPVAFLFDSTGAFLQRYLVGLAAGESFRSVSLDPDGISFWDCCNSTIGGSNAVRDLPIRHQKWADPRSMAASRSALRDGCLRPTAARLTTRNNTVRTRCSGGIMLSRLSAADRICSTTCASSRRDDLWGPQECVNISGRVWCLSVPGDLAQVVDPGRKAERPAERTQIPHAA